MIILHNNRLWRVIAAIALLAGQVAQAAINLDINSVGMAIDPRLILPSIVGSD